MDRAQMERLTQLTLAAQGKPTKRPLVEILISERSAAANYIARAPAISTGIIPIVETESQSQ